MKFYTKQHKFYCGIDLHARVMYMCILDQEGNIVLHKNMKSGPEPFLRAIADFRDDLVVAVECIFTWYWLADLCAQEGIPFVLGHALYMKAIHGGKAKNDRIDAHKIATLLRGGMIPQAYVYPPEMRATRDLLRRRIHLTHQKVGVLTHIQNTNSQYNLEPIGKNIAYKAHREGVAETFTDPSARMSIEMDLYRLDYYDRLLNRVELFIIRNARQHDRDTYLLLQSIPGIGKILALVILYETHDIRRFPRVQDFISYCRLVKCSKESAGKKHGFAGKKIGNAYLKWAFSEAAILFLRRNPEAQKYLERLTRKYGKPKALTLLAQKLARTVYHMLMRKEVFNPKRFFVG